MKSFKQIREACWTGFKQVGLKKKGKKMVPNCVPEDAPANSAGGGNIAGIGVGPDGEPGVMPRAALKYKKKNKEDLKGRMTKFLSKFRTVEQYNQQEVENIINKIQNNQEVIENEIDPMVKFLKRKKSAPTTEEAIKSFRYVVDKHTSSLSEEIRNEVAKELIEMYL